MLKLGKKFALAASVAIVVVATSTAALAANTAAPAATAQSSTNRGKCVAALKAELANLTAKVNQANATLGRLEAGGLSGKTIANEVMANMELGEAGYKLPLPTECGGEAAAANQ